MPPLPTPTASIAITASSFKHNKRHIGLPRWLSGKDSACNEGTWVQSLGQEDPLEEGMATHSSVLAWRFPWAEEPGGLQSMGS